MKPNECILFSGGAAGAEAEFGSCAERHGIEKSTSRSRATTRSDAAACVC